MANINSRNVFFNNHSLYQEQNLLEDLIVEQHAIHAPQMYYLPRVLRNKDDVYSADDLSTWNRAFLVPIYIESFDKFQGMGEFMSKFNLEVHHQIVLSIAMRTFKEEIGDTMSQVRPNEGDIVFFPFNQHCFQIKFVDKFEMLYPLGKLYVWQMTCELFEYSSEKFDTGIPEIDSLGHSLSANIPEFAILTEADEPILLENGDYWTMEDYNLSTILRTGTNDLFEEEAEVFIDFSEDDPFSEGDIID